MKRARRVIAFMLTIVMVLQSTVVAGANPDVFGNNFDNESVGSNNGDANDTGDVDMTNGTGSDAELSDQQQSQEIFGDNSGEMNNPDQESQTDGAPVSQAEVSSDAVQSVLQYVNEDGSKDTYIRYQITLHNAGTAAAENLPVNIVLPQALTYAGYPGSSDETAVGIDTGSGVEIGGTVYDRAISWMNQTLEAGASAKYVAYAKAKIGVTDMEALTATIYADGTSVAASWQDASLLAENVAPTPEAEVTPEETETPEPEETESPQETPEVTPTPEPTETPTIEEILEENKENQQNNNSLKPKRRMMAAKANVVEETSNNFADYLKSATILTDGNPYDPDNDDPLYNNGFFDLRLEFGEDPYQFPVYDPETRENEFVYNIPEIIKGIEDISNQKIVDKSKTDEQGNPVAYGEYDIIMVGDGNVQVKIRFYDTVKTYINCAGYITFHAQFNREKVPDDNKEEIKFGGNVTIKVEFKEGGKLAANKTASQYDPETKSFEFTITIIAEEDLTEEEEITITDTLGESLQLIQDSARLDNTNVSMTPVEGQRNTYSVNLGSLEKGTHTLTYRASITDDALEKYNGVILGLGNTAVLQSGDTTITTDCDAEYYHKWIQKENEGVGSDNRIKWTVVLNPGAQQDASGMTVTDRLPRGLNYDTNEPIQVTEKSLDGNTKETELQWNAVLAQDGRSWSYTPESANQVEYTFTYYTTIENGYAGDTVENTATAGDHSTGSSVKLPSGSGSGTGSGNGIDKISEGTETIDGTKYVKWQATLTIQENSDSVIFRDELFGTHEFVTPLVVNQSNNVPVYQNVSVTSSDLDPVDLSITVHDNKSFTLDFGEVEALKTFTIEYYSKVLENGQLRNLGNLSTDDKAYSKSAETTVMDGNFSKIGNYNPENDTITWKIRLNEKGNQLVANPLVIKDTLSPNQIYQQGSAKVGGIYWDGEDQREPDSYNTETNTLQFNIWGVRTDRTAYLTYKTKVKDGLNRDQDILCQNEVEITINNEKVADIGASVNVPSKLFDKSLITNPTKENRYKATFEMVINENNNTLGAEEYIIKDSPSSNMEIDKLSLKVEQRQNNSWKEISNTLNETGDPYYEVSYAPDNATITIKNAEKTSNRTYRIRYDATVHVSPGSGTEPWNNNAEFWYGDHQKEDHEYGEIQKSQNTDSGMTGDYVYLKIYKDTSGVSKPLAGATFALYELNENGAIKGDAVQTVTTGRDGIAYLGQKPEGSASGYWLKENQRYLLREIKAPVHYQAAEDIYFQIGDKITDGQYRSFKIADIMQISDMPLTSVAVEKKWEDGNNQDGTRPNSVTVDLLANRNKTGKTLTLGQNNWSGEWTDLPVYTEDGEKIDYTVQEADVKGYTSEITGGLTEETIEGTDIKTYSYTITNSYTPGKVSVDVTKEWNDDNDRDGKRPESITVTLHGKVGNEAVYTESKTLSETNNWFAEWTNLDEKKDGTTINYTVTEEFNDEAYINGNPEKTADGNHISYKITNTHKPEKTDITLEKQWTGDQGYRNTRPNTITVALYKTVNDTTTEMEKRRAIVVPNALGDWEHTWEDLPVYEGGEKITYSAKELGKIPDYVPENPTADSNGCVLADENNKITLINDYQPKTSITAEKVWDDSNNQDGKRWDSVTLTLLADDVQVEEVTLTKDNVKSDNPNVWTYTWNNLEKYRAGGEKIEYTVEETIPDETNGYTTTYSDDRLTVTNSYKPEDTKIKVKKVWDDKDNNDGKRPTELTVNLLKNGKKYQPYTLTEAKNWEHTWENLPVYENGEKITYTVTEDYEGTTWEKDYKNTQLDKSHDLNTNTWTFILTNTHTNETVDKTVTKIWEDKNNQDVVRPYAIVVRLYQQVNGEEKKMYTGKGAEQVLTGTENRWTYTWKNLPKYSGGKEITYTVEEVGCQMTSEEDRVDGPIPGYELPEYSPDTFTITNRREPYKVEAKVTKVWEDNKNHDGKRPESIRVQLYQYVVVDGEVQDKDLYGGPVTISGEDDVYKAWTYEWSGLPKYRNNNGEKQEWQYTVEEEAVAGYTAKVERAETSADNTFEFTLTNTHSDEKVEVEVTKNWEDNSDQDGIRPESIYLQLYRTPKGGEIESVDEPVKIDQENKLTDDIWSYKWEKLDKYQTGGALYTYTVEEGQLNDFGEFVPFTEEAPLKGYTCSYSDPEVKEETGNTAITITNTHETDEISVNLIKSWIEDDPENRPTEVTFTLM